MINEVGSKKGWAQIPDSAGELRPAQQTLSETRPTKQEPQAMSAPSLAFATRRARKTTRARIENLPST
eukprot:9189453-Pyramimonas_sp.AAC.1